MRDGGERGAAAKVVEVYAAALIDNEHVAGVPDQDGL
jgi:hypothetical protein